MDPVTTARMAASSIATEAGPAKEAVPVQPPPSPEQVKAIESVFTQQQDEARAAQGLLGFWASAYLLHDLAVEHFWQSHDEDEQKPKLKDDEEVEEDPV